MKHSLCALLLTLGAFAAQAQTPAGPTASGVMASKRGRSVKSSRGLSWAVSVRSFMSSQMGDGG